MNDQLQPFFVKLNGEKSYHTVMAADEDDAVLFVKTDPSRKHVKT